VSDGENEFDVDWEAIARGELVPFGVTTCGGKVPTVEEIEANVEKLKAMRERFDRERREELEEIWRDHPEMRLPIAMAAFEADMKRLLYGPLIAGPLGRALGPGFSPLRDLLSKSGRFELPSDRCVCGKTRIQHETQWPACRGFKEVKDG
jgi:hypothetical protein